MMSAYLLAVAVVFVKGRCRNEIARLLKYLMHNYEDLSSDFSSCIIARHCYISLKPQH